MFSWIILQQPFATGYIIITILQIRKLRLRETDLTKIIKVRIHPYASQKHVLSLQPGQEGNLAAALVPAG